MSVYGGIGTLIETRENGSIEVSPYTQWPFYQNHFRNNTPQRTFAPDWYAKDSRLLYRLQCMGFNNLRQLFIPQPIDVADNRFPYYPNVNRAAQSGLISGRLMPEWMYCPNCRKLQHVNQWNLQNQGFCCNQHDGRLMRVEQVRFILVSMDSGEILDVPWSRLFSHFGDPALAWEFTMQEQEIPVWYSTSRNSDSLFGVRVRDAAPNQTGRSFTIAELMRHYFIINGHAYKVQLRNGNNISFPYIINSIYIPRISISIADANELGNLYENGVRTAQGLCNVWNPGHPNALIPEDVMQQLINANFEVTEINAAVSEVGYLKDEMDYITNRGNYNGQNLCNADLNFVSQRYDQLCPLPNRVENLYCLRKIKETSVQVACSRIDKGHLANLNIQDRIVGGGARWWSNGAEQDNVPIGVTLPNGGDARGIYYMPAVEAWGEGLFVELNLNGIEDKFVFLHTYCHLIMKELEFQCGYTLTSLKERLYCLDETNQYGFIIYSIAGSDGSYGGISSLFNQRDGGMMPICQIMDNVKIRAKDCPNDPICSGEGGHCFACLDLPETSCTEFNDRLNRNVFLQYIG